LPNGSVHESSGGLRFILTNHAIERMAKRNVSVSDVAIILDTYDIFHTDRVGNPCFMKTLQDGRTIRVVIAKESSPWLVVTVVALD